MKKLQDGGFSVVEGLLAILFVGLVGGIGYYVYTQKTSSSEEKSISSQNTAETAETTCGDGWTIITTETVALSDWNVHLTIDQDLIGEAVCRKDPNTNPQYLISTKDITEKKCYAHLSQLGLADPVVSIWRYEGGDLAVGNLYTDDAVNKTFQEYFDENKVDNTNYVKDESGVTKYYNVGDAFYYQSGGEIYDLTSQDVDKFKPGVQPLEINESELKTNCPNIKPGYVKQFGNLAATLTEAKNRLWVNHTN